MRKDHYKFCINLDTSIGQAPYYILLTGFPSAGKSTVSNFLQKQGFAKYCTDDFRESVFGIEDYTKFRQIEGFKENNRMIFDLIKYGSLSTLARGENAVVDFTSRTEGSRDWGLSTIATNQLGELYEIPSKKTIIYLLVDEDLLRERNKKRGRTNNPISEWKEKGWEEPVSRPDCDLIIYPNNSEKDLDFIKRDLKKRFG